MTNYIVAKDYLCFMALVEMIVSETNPCNNFTQTDFAESFGITVPIGADIPIKNVQYSNNIKDWGTNVSVKELNAFFHKYNIPLVVSYIPSNFFNELNFNDLVLAKSRNSFVVFAFCYGVLYNEIQNYDVGHVVLFENLDEKNDLVSVYDPGPRNVGSKVVRVDDIIYAMKRRGGIFLFEKIDRS